MQGLCDGYFVIPYTIADYLAEAGPGAPDPQGPAFREAEEAVRDYTQRLIGVGGKRSARSIHIELGKILWENCGMSRSEKSLKQALELIPQLRVEFWDNLFIPGRDSELNAELERAGRVADFLEFAELMCRDALDRDESCGAHFREEHQTPEGEAVRDDENHTHVSVWEFIGEDSPPNRHKEPLEFQNVDLSVRSYK